MKNWKKKLMTLTALSLLGLGTAQVIQAITFSNGPKWVRSTEQLQLRYFGEAYTKAARGAARGIYKRDGRVVGSVTALVPSWSDAAEDYQTTYVWDSLISGRRYVTQFYAQW
ncbi:MULTISPECIES: hypothetical protein [Streptococcus]|uniref:hypothetical protein n=1 Tax=Streptococcus TaxID=1301 RepID=UPI0011EA6410|nr:hypothetical protein [Streptococcus entericus]